MDRENTKPPVSETDPAPPQDEGEAQGGEEITYVELIADNGKAAAEIASMLIAQYDHLVEEESKGRITEPMLRVLEVAMRCQMTAIESFRATAPPEPKATDMAEEWMRRLASTLGLPEPKVVPKPPSS